MRAALLAPALAGCCLAQGAARDVSLDVREVAHSAYCNTAGDAPAVLLLDGPQAVMNWQREHSVALAEAEPLAPAPYAIVEHGARRTGGYGVTVARPAALRGGQLVLQATFSAPPPGAMTTQALSSPCVLVQLPPGRYTGVEVRDAAGALRASGSFTPPQRTPEPSR